jgi:hypothetical protein
MWLRQLPSFQFLCQQRLVALLANELKVTVRVILTLNRPESEKKGCSGRIKSRVFGGVVE